MNTMGKAWKLGALEIKNRLVRSATVEGLSTKTGAPTRKLIDLTTALARGGVGLIIAGTAYISRDGMGDVNTTGMDHDDLIEPLSQLCHEVHNAGGLVAAQLLHCGSTLNPALLPERKFLYGPSALTDPLCGEPVREMNNGQIDLIVKNYAKAALRAKKSGFDALQLHAAHGYLINQFLSPYRNHRTDKYGGSLRNRARLLYEVYEAVRKSVGNAFPVFIKLSGYDGFQGGVTSEDATQIATDLDTMGIDAIEVSAGTPEGAKLGGWDHIIPAPFQEGSLLKYALAIKERVNCPVISVEGWRDPAKITKALIKVDAVSMSRPFIREPDLANRWLSGDLEPAHCISCNKCLDLIKDSGLGCIFHKQQ